MELSARIDWISVTYPYETEKKDQMLVWSGEGKGWEMKAHSGYTVGLRFLTGATLEYNPDRSDMGKRVTYSGSALDNCTEFFACNQADLLAYLTREARIGRLDLALDVYGWKAPYQKMLYHHQQGKTITKAKSSSYDRSAKHKSPNPAQTIYIGSRLKRTKLLRVYDKGAQLGIPDLISRFEIETRSKYAQSASKTLKRANFGDYGAIIRGMIKAFCQWPEIRSVHRFFESDEPIPISSTRHVRGDTAKWLLDSVAPVLARETVDDPALMTEFMVRVADTMRGIGVIE